MQYENQSLSTSAKIAGQQGTDQRFGFLLQKLQSEINSD